MLDKDKARGCLIGGAAGDALGYTVEFMSETSIFAEYGDKGITDYELRQGKALFSDDTQMTLFTAEGLIRGGDPLGSIREMYKQWYITQTESCGDKYSGGCRLMKVPELYSRRAPGNTCLSALHAGAQGSISQPINGSKGCGGVMRVAPIGLYFAGSQVSYDESDMLGAQACALTHGHELGYIPGAALVHIVRAVCEGIPLKQAVTDSISAAQRLFSGAEHIGYFTRLMKKAAELSETGTADLDAIHQLGEGWVAEETLAIAVYCALRHETDFAAALTASVNHNGDSDSTGAVMGNILGAYLGCKAIPEKFKKNLELLDVITETADLLCKKEAV